MRKSEVQGLEIPGIPKVAAIVVNWNGKSDLLECLESLKRLDYPAESLLIMVVDNGSTDGSREAVQNRFEKVVLLLNRENLGYVKAVNRGVEYARKEGAEYIWILNNDVVVAEDSLRILVETGEKCQNAGVIGPIIYSYCKPDRVDNAGYRIDLWTGRMTSLRFGEDLFKDPGKDIEVVESNVGCSNLVKARVFDEVGLLNPVYQVYFEETDFNFRVRKKGFTVVLAKKAKVRHKHGSTMNNFMIRRAWLLLRNLFIFEILNASPRNLAVFIPYYFFIHVPFFLVYGIFYGIREKGRILFRVNTF